VVRTLSLKSERLAALGTEELQNVVGAVSGTTCLSNQIISLCGCLTDYCSIDVC